MKYSEKCVDCGKKIPATKRYKIIIDKTILKPLCKDCFDERYKRNIDDKKQ